MLAGIDPIAFQLNTTAMDGVGIIQVLVKAIDINIARCMTCGTSRWVLILIIGKWMSQAMNEEELNRYLCTNESIDRVFLSISFTRNIISWEVNQGSRPVSWDRPRRRKGLDNIEAVNRKPRGDFYGTCLALSSLSRLLIISDRYQWFWIDKINFWRKRAWP